MKITAVVVTYNRLNLLKQVIEALKKNNPSDIIVINNGSTDGSREWLDEQTGINVVHQDNVGGSGGFYTGIKKAYQEGADWIWCMDDDVMPHADCLSHLLRHAQRPGIGILSPRRLHDGKVFTHEFQRFNFSNPLTSMHAGKLAKMQIDKSTPIVGCDFEGPFISRRVVERIGLPNKDLFIFYDDTDYCLRAHLAGFELLYVPEALMDKYKFFNNDNWTTRNRKKKWKRYYQVRNNAYLNHHYGKNWSVRYLRSLIGVLGYYIPALLSMPFNNAWQMRDIKLLWEAYTDGVNERLGKYEQ